MTYRGFRFASIAVVLCVLGGCTSTETAVTPVDTATDDEPTRIALRTGPSAGPGEIDGFCENGAGVYLSADDDAARLTLYVVTPAAEVTFERPELQLVTQQDDHQEMKVSEFESVTLRAGESWTLSERADGPLMDVFAEIDARVTAAW